jgi:hypothetical protein
MTPLGFSKETWYSLMNKLLTSISNVLTIGIDALPNTSNLFKNIKKKQFYSSILEQDLNSLPKFQPKTSGPKVISKVRNEFLTFEIKIRRIFQSL